MMFKTTRSGKGKPLVWVMMGLLVLGLTGFGLSGLSRVSRNSIGSVGTEKILVNTYVRALRGSVNDWSSRIGRNLTSAEIEALGIAGAVLNAVVDVAAVDNEAARLGVSVGDEVVREEILGNPNFQGLDGNFDKEAYDFFLERRLQVSPSEFDELLRKENSRALLEGGIGTGIASGDAVPLAILAYFQETRDFEWAWVTDLQLSEPAGKPGDAQLRAYYGAHKDAYHSLKTHAVTYAWLSPDMLLNQIDVPEEQLRESYDLQSDRFNKAEQRAVERLVFPSAAEAEAARNQLDAGTTTFAALVAKRGLELSDVDMGEVAAKALSQAAADVVFSADGPGIVGPVESALGPAIFRINAVLGADFTPFEEAREQLFAELAGEAARRMVSDLITDIDDLLAAGATLEELAADTDMELEALDFTAESDAGIAGYMAFREAVLNASEGDFPELVDLSDGGVFALRVDEVRAPALIPFEEVMQQVTTDWTRAENLKLLVVVAQDYKIQLESGAEFARLGLGPNAEQGVLRNARFDGLPRQAVFEVFAMQPGQVIALEGGSGVFLARLSRINAFDATAEGNAGIVGQLTASLNSQIAVDVLELYTAALQENAGVEINYAMVNSVISQIAAR